MFEYVTMIMYFFGRAEDLVMKIVIGCDHGALALKEEVKKVLAEYPDVEVNDVGTYTEDSVDYPDIAENDKGCGGA